MPLKPGKMTGSQFTGPIRTKREGNTIDYPSGSGRQATITLTAQAAGTAGTYTITDRDALVNDVIDISPVGAVAPQAGITGIMGYVLTEGTITVRVQNSGAGALTAGPMTVGYVIQR